jgi:signal transduction histidine kinase
MSRNCPIFFLLAAISLALPRMQSADAIAPMMDEVADSALDPRILAARREHLTDSTHSRALAEEALAAARAAGDRRNEAAALVEFGVALRRQNQNALAVQQLRSALAITETLGDRGMLRRTLKEAGHTFWALGDLPNATDYFQRALRLSEEDGDVGAQADAHAGLGAVATDLLDQRLARAHQEQALNLAEKAGQPSRIALYAANLGNVLLGEKDYVGARQLYERAETIFTQLGERTNRADARADLARVDVAEGKLAEAEKTLRALLPSRRRLVGRVKLTNTLVQLAQVLQMEGKPDEAIGFLNEAWGYTSQLTASSKVAILDALAMAHEARGDYPSAIKALRQRQEVDASQRGAAAQARVAELREAFAAERREAEIARLRDVEHSRAVELRATEAELRARQFDLERSRWQRYGLFSVMALGLVALAAIISRQRLKARAARRALEDAQAAWRAAEQADRIKTRFLGIASHDIRGPMGNILSLTKELRAQSPRDELHAERCDLIGSEAQRVVSLVEDLVTTAALESGRLELRCAPLDLADTTREVVSALRWQAEAKRQRIDFPEPEMGTGLLSGDAARLHQVLSNVISNALKFSPAGETISLELTRTESSVQLRVRDRGPGIAPADIPRLFAPFGRLETPTTGGESSHGLGLSIAHEIVRKHGGEIHVESQPGAGATFTIELPVTAMVVSTPMRLFATPQPFTSGAPRPELT